MIGRREFITLLGGAAAWPIAAGAQQQPTNPVRIGFLRAAGPNDKDFNAFRSGLRALGYVEGQNIVIEQRYAAGSYDRVGELAAELVRLNMDVIVVDGPAAAKPAKAATAHIPIVLRSRPILLRTVWWLPWRGQGATSPDLHYPWVTSWLENVWSSSRISSLTLLDWRS
jgi:hypothetical protein